MDQGIWNRIGPICGLLFVAALLTAYVVMPEGSPPTDPGYWPAGAPAETIARHLEAQREALQLGWTILGLAQVLLVVFLVDTYHRVRRGVRPGSQWPATLFLVGGLMVVVVWLFHLYLWRGLTNFADFGDDVQVAKALNALVMNSLQVIVPGVVIMMAAAMVISFKLRAMPLWFGIVALVALLAAPIYWVPVWVLWVLSASVALLLDPKAADTREEAAAST